MLLSELPVGSLVKDDLTLIKATYSGSEKNVVPIFRLLEHNHEGDPENSTAFEFRDILGKRSFDGKEPNNPTSVYANYGNNRYKYSNMFQWLNSESEPGQWYVPQHEYDTPPSADYVQAYPYDTDCGFLNYFSLHLRRSLLTTTKVNKISFYGTGTEEVSSKIWLLSATEIGVSNSYITSSGEGSLYSYYADVADKQKKELVDNYNTTDWALRSPAMNFSYEYAGTAGGYGRAPYSNTAFGVSPAFCLPQSLKVSDVPDGNGIYTLQWDRQIFNFYVGINGKAVALPLKIKE